MIKINKLFIKDNLDLIKDKDGEKLIIIKGNLKKINLMAMVDLLLKIHIIKVTLLEVCIMD
jgi:hypothetical protein